MTATDTATDVELTATDEDRENQILYFCKTPRTREEIQKFVNIKYKVYFLKDVLAPLIKTRKLSLTISNKPKSKNQKYIATIRQ
ncbi:MAG: hypothetical protein LBV16_01245 [Elusimicrobiota bacterium]|jgi:ATP-dependent DNA helicase RecG|nr:hypothetical protein [Elusimicrobiota bacterium]